MPNPDKPASDALAGSTSGYDQELNRTTVHDPGIYAPDDTEDRIVLMYETPAAARAAQVKLAAIGIPESRARIMSHTPDGIDAGIDYEGGEHGLWSYLKSLFTSDAHAHGYAEGVRRGHALLVVHPDIGRRLEAVRLLETTGPIDFDARLEEWRSAGWDNLAAHRNAAVANHGEATVYDTATRTSEKVSVPGGVSDTGAAGSHPVDYPTIGNITSKPAPGF